MAVKPLKTIKVVVPAEDSNKFRQVCTDMGLQPAALLRFFLYQVLRGHFNICPIILKDLAVLVRPPFRKVGDARGTRR